MKPTTLKQFLHHTITISLLVVWSFLAAAAAKLGTYEVFEGHVPQIYAYWAKIAIFFKEII